MIKREAIDDVVVAGILKRAEPFIDFSRVKKLFRNRVQEYLDGTPDRLDQVERALNDINKQIDRMAEAYSKFGRTMPEDRVRELSAHKRALEGELKELLATGQGRIVLNADKEAEQFFAEARDARSILAAGSAHDRIHLRERFLHSATVEWAQSGTFVKLQWRKLPRVYSAGDTPRLHQIESKLDHQEEIVTECYEYKDCALISA